MKKNLKDKKSLNIAMLGHKRIPSREGGIEIVVEELATRMITLGHKVTCYNRSGHHVSGKDFDGGKRKAYKGVRLKSVLTLDKKGLAAMTASVSGAICAAFGKYDVVHFHAEGPCAMLWLPKLFGKRCIATVHGLDHQRAKWGKLASTYIMLGEKCAVKFADEIIVLSKGVQDYFKETYGRETKFIPNGVNRPVIRKPELIKEKYGLEKDDYILFLGRLVPEKGIAYLIEAFKKVNTDKKLVIAGGSSDTDEFASQLKEMAKDDDRIIFTGFVQGQLLDELYSNAYIIMNGKVLLCDELEAGLHESLVFELIRLFMEWESDNFPQIFFTTHETGLLNMDLFRRDQIWFTEMRLEDRSTELYSLAEIKNIRKDENFGKGYISGKYGGIPMLNVDFANIVSKM